MIEEQAAKRRPARSLRRLAELEVSEIKRVGARRAESLGKLGIHSVLDLLTTYPRRYIDRTRQVDLSDLAVGDEAVVFATITAASSPPSGRGGPRGRSRLVFRAEDATASLEVVFFNQPWRAKQLTVGDQILLFGKMGEYGGKPQMVNPVVDLLASRDGGEQLPERVGRVIPIYPASTKERVSTWQLATYIGEALRRTEAFVEPLPEKLLDRIDLMDRSSAMRSIHAPEEFADIAPARRRLAFDELLRLQLALVVRRALIERDAVAIEHAVSRRDLELGSLEAQSLLSDFLSHLPFTMTGAQERVIAEIIDDLASTSPMHRLLQGDVGSGKTLVAAAALVAAVAGGHQGALLAPTEVLADQHLAGLRGLLNELVVPDPKVLGGSRPLKVALLAGKVTGADRRELLKGLADGSIDIAIGTHALLSEGVVFHSLGVVVVDEQHRFGVEQRARLREEGRADATVPDLLVMTATPIPRTAAMVVFGDLDTSILDELPPGRTPIVTSWLQGEAASQEAFAEIRREVAAGRQAYVVCPLVEDSEKMEEARSATAEFERLGHEELQGLRLGLIHGQMSTDEKESIMASFRRGEIDVLVATTVIEVGVDVANATVMVIEDAWRFGIAQLHQLRGRVGRGSAQSSCFLLGDPPSPEGKRRLEAIASTTDGFLLAEVDLELRGEGTILGSRQRGRSDLKLASLKDDKDLLIAAREVAEELVAGDATLSQYPELVDELRLFLADDDADFLFKA